jgi:hypothetical protein
VELLVLLARVGVPPLGDQLGRRPPTLLGLGLAIALAAVPAVLLVDAAHKGARYRAHRSRGRPGR